MYTLNAHSDHHHFSFFFSWNMLRYKSSCNLSVATNYFYSSKVFSLARPNPILYTLLVFVWVSHLAQVVFLVLLVSFCKFDLLIFLVEFWKIWFVCCCLDRCYYNLVFVFCCVVVNIGSGLSWVIFAFRIWVSALLCCWVAFGYWSMTLWFDVHLVVMAALWSFCTSFWFPTIRKTNYNPATNA